MWLPLVNETINSNQKLREYAEQKGKENSKLYREIKNGTLKKEVETLIEEKEAGWLYKIKELLSKKENAALKSRDDELMLVDRLCLCSEKERKSGKLSLLYQCDSLQQIKEIYQITVFYLTRIEVGMEKECYIDFPKFIKEWNLSPEYMVMVLGNGQFCDKEYIGKQLAEILKEQGEQSYAHEVLKGIMELGKKV